MQARPFSAFRNLRRHSSYHIPHTMRRYGQEQLVFRNRLNMKAACYGGLAPRTYVRNVDELESTVPMADSEYFHPGKSSSLMREKDNILKKEDSCGKCLFRGPSCPESRPCRCRIRRACGGTERRRSGPSGKRRPLPERPPGAVGEVWSRG